MATEHVTCPNCRQSWNWPDQMRPANIIVIGLMWLALSAVHSQNSRMDDSIENMERYLKRISTFDPDMRYSRRPMSAAQFKREAEEIIAIHRSVTAHLQVEEAEIEKEERAAAASVKPSATPSPRQP